MRSEAPERIQTPAADPSSALRYRTPRKSRLWTCLLASMSLLVILSMTGQVTAAPGLPPGIQGQQGQFIPGLAASAAIWAQTDSPWGNQFLSSQDLVYDTSVTVLIDYAGLTEVSIEIAAEQYTPGTEQVIENTTHGNVTVTVPVMLDIQNASISMTLYPRSYQYAVLALPAASSQQDLNLSVGGAVWHLTHLTPTGSSLAGTYSTGGINALLLEFGVLMAVTMIVAMVTSARFARSVYRVPRPPPWWGALWIGVPAIAYLGAYVPTNQFLGWLTPFAYPAFIAIGVWPYLGGIWKHYRWAEFQGVVLHNSEDATMPKATFPLVRKDDGLYVAPETWLEAVATSRGVALPEVDGPVVGTGDARLRVVPHALPVTCPVEGRDHKVEADDSYWYLAEAGIKRTYHRLRLLKTESVTSEHETEAGTKMTVTTTKRRLRPWIERGSLSVKPSFIRDVAEYSVGARTIGQEALENEEDQLKVRYYRGTILHERRVARETSNEVYVRAATGDHTALTDEELMDRVRAGLKSTLDKMSKDGETTDEGQGKGD